MVQGRKRQSEDKNVLHLISHTHWDREWYLTFQQFRMRLVMLVDELLDILENVSGYKYFMLDGQTILLEDYLEIRPENADRLRRLIAQGRIQIGPWYVLPDEFLVSGESLIRNLIYGKKAAEGFGPVMNVGYLPDQFGHISQMPQILKGFGMNSAVIWRGVGDSDGGELDSEFLWESPDGSQVLTLRLPADRPRDKNDNLPAQAEVSVYDNDGYFNAARLPAEPKAAAERIGVLAQKLEQYAGTRHLLLMNGVDHARPQPELPEIIAGANGLLNGAQIVHSTLPLLFEAIRSETPKLSAVPGEFRRRREGDILFGTLSTRPFLKQANEAAQTQLERWSEPFAAAAWSLGADYQRKYFDLAWKFLLKNHPHDSICGCSVDAVHEEMMTRYASCRQITEELLIEAFRNIVGRIDLSHLGDDEQTLVLFNPALRSRSEVVETTVSFPADANVRGLTLHSPAGEEIPITVLRHEPYVFDLDPVKVLFFEKASRFTISFRAADVPAMGYRCYVVRPADAPAAEAAPAEGVLENELLRLQVHPDGTFDLLEKRSGRLAKGCNLLEDGGDNGDFYNYSPPKNDEIVRGLKNGRVTSAGGNAVLVTGELHLPGSVSQDRQSRTAEQVCCPVSVTAALRQRRVDVCIRIDNHAKDHRLRTLLPTGVNAEKSCAAGQLDVVSRPIGAKETGDWFEEPLPTYPQETFVDVSDGRQGTAVFTRGLPECEAIPAAEGVTLAITLMRCVEAITRGGLATTNRNQSDPPWQPSPGGQCPGDCVFHYSVFPHAGDWSGGGVAQEAEAYRLPCRGVTCRGNTGGPLPAEGGFLQIQPNCLELSAMKLSEDGSGLIVRLVNLTDKAGQATLGIYGKVESAARVSLAEEELQPLPVGPDGSVTFQYGANEIITVKICCRR